MGASVLVVVTMDKFQVFLLVIAGIGLVSLGFIIFMLTGRCSGLVS